MDRSLWAVTPHSRLMELKNSGAVDVSKLEDAANAVFVELKSKIVAYREEHEPQGFISRLFSGKRNMEWEVDRMFETRSELVEHLVAVTVPTALTPVSQEDKERLLFLDRASLYAAEARRVLDMFRNHNEVIVGPETSHVISWIIRNAPLVRQALEA